MEVESAQYTSDTQRNEIRHTLAQLQSCLHHMHNGVLDTHDDILHMNVYTHPNSISVDKHSHCALCSTVNQPTDTSHQSISVHSADYVCEFKLKLKQRENGILRICRESSKLTLFMVS